MIITFGELKMNSHNDIVSAKKTIDKEIDALRILENQIDDNFTKALDLMQNAKGRVVVTGMGKSGHIGQKIAATLASTGTPSFFVHPAEASHGDLGMLTTNDVVLAISNSGESKELADILVYCKRYGLPLIAMTKNPESTLGKAGDILLKLPDCGEACPLGLAPTSSTTATLVFGDILAVALMERKGFSSLDYKQRHPGGKLGAVLKKVADLMHTGDELPLVPDYVTLKDAILVMSSKMLGCVGIVDKDNNLQGIFTDGDLRRIIANIDMNTKITDIMIKNPKTIDKDALLVEAINKMNNTGKGITQLFVVENDKPIGIIHIHDCLRAGVA